MMRCEERRGEESTRLHDRLPNTFACIKSETPLGSAAPSFISPRSLILSYPYNNNRRKGREAMAGGDPSDDLDQLLDSALDDFNKLDLAAPSSSSSSSPPARGNKPSPSAPTGLGMGLPDPRAKRSKAKQRAPAPAPPPPHASLNYASEALEKLTQQTRDAVRGLETATATSLGAPAAGMSSNEEAMVEEFVKQFEQLAGSQDMESIVETMMQQLLSKDILYEPMKEIAQKYPKWLEEHKESLSKDDYSRYSRQYQFIVQLNEVYENDSENFTKIVELMQKMQDCGQPPNDIVQEIAPDLDLANLGQLSPEMLEGAPNCGIM